MQRKSKDRTFAHAAKQQEATPDCKDRLIQRLQLAVLEDVARRLLAVVQVIEGAVAEGAGEAAGGAGARWVPCFRRAASLSAE